MRVSQAKGVYFHKATGKWVIKARVAGELKSLGYFLTEDEAKKKLAEYYLKNPDSREIYKDSEKTRVIAFINSCSLEDLRELLYLVKLRTDGVLE
jgi:hypothetical protein